MTITITALVMAALATARMKTNKEPKKRMNVLGFLGTRGGKNGDTGCTIS